MAGKTPASSDIYYFRIARPLAVFLPALLGPVPGRAPLGGASADRSQSGPLSSLASSAWLLPGAGGGKGRGRGCRKGATPSAVLGPLQTPSFLAGIFLGRLLGRDELREQELRSRFPEIPPDLWPRALKSSQPGESAWRPVRTEQQRVQHLMPAGLPCWPGPAPRTLALLSLHHCPSTPASGTPGSFLTVPTTGPATRPPLTQLPLPGGASFPFVQLTLHLS